ncbi:MAG: chorismate mutase [Gemmatimonadetes bacterium]|nr:chorismate mutase [Gemmatimonadota bacterium]MDE3257993.1 chorismate mutase [Gemmatimonadota bacterium]
MDLEDWRKEIDVLDRKLLKLLNRRAECAIEIGRIKQAIEQPIFVPEREMSILNRILELNKGPLDAEAVRRIFQQIIDESRRLMQKNQGS